MTRGRPRPNSIDRFGPRRAIGEPGLPDLVCNNVQEGRLTFADPMMDDVGRADVVFIAVGTPSRRDHGHADLSNVFDVSREIAAALDGLTVIVAKDGLGWHLRRDRPHSSSGEAGHRRICRLKP